MALIYCRIRFRSINWEQTDGFDQVLHMHMTRSWLEVLHIIFCTLSVRPSSRYILVFEGWVGGGGGRGAGGYLISTDY